MTYADMKAVNSEVVTPWKEDLLWQLYVETYNQLTLGLADDQYTQQPSLESDIADIAKLLPRIPRCKTSGIFWMAFRGNI
jgi:UTP:GlnB (protein PII) uridylyltransferase